MTTPLETLIAEANSLGWAVAILQHPDGGSRWECRLSRPAEQTVNGITREIAFARGHSPAAALDYALDHGEHTYLTPTGAPGSEPAVDLAALLNIKPASAIPRIERRI